jgi:hypothetical protein
MILAPKKHPVFIQMASGTFSTLVTLPYYLSRSCQIIEPQLNRGSIHSPAQRSFVRICFKNSTRYHLSRFSHLPIQYQVSLRGCTHPKQSPGNTQSAISKIPPPQTKQHHLFKTLPWSSSNQNGFVPRIFSKTSQIKLPSGKTASICCRLLQGRESPTPPFSINH